MPLVLKAGLTGQTVKVFGTDYATPDGTCLRDYIHVSDLAAVHEAAMKRLLNLSEDEGRFEAFNLGTQNGVSVREVIQACERALKMRIATVDCERRLGDPARLVADSALARRELNFRLQYSLNDIVESALQWEFSQYKSRRAA